MRTIIFPLSIFLLVFILTPAYGQPAGKIRLGLSEFPPYIIVNGNKVSGIDIELAHLIADRLNLEIEYYQCSWKRCLSYMKHGTIDVLTGMFKRPEREKYAHFITPHYVQGTQAFYLLNKRDLEINTYDDIRNLKIGIERGAGNFEPFDSDPSLRKYDFNTRKQAVKLVLKGWLDTFISATIVTDYYLLQNNLDTQIRKSNFRYQGKTALAFFAISKKSRYASDLQKFDKVLNDIVSEGGVDAILTKYSQGGDIREFPLK